MNSELETMDQLSNPMYYSDIHLRITGQKQRKTLFMLMKIKIEVRDLESSQPDGPFSEEEERGFLLPPSEYKLEVKLSVYLIKHRAM